MLSRLKILCCIGALASVGAPIAASGATQAQSKPEELPARHWLVPSGPAAASYQSIPLVGRRERDSDSLAADIAVEVGRAVAAAHAPPLVRDSRLDRVATDLAAWTAERPLPPFEAIAFLLAHYGVVEQPGPNVILVRGSVADERSVVTELRGQLRASFAGQSLRRWGVGIQRKASRLIVLLALQDQQLDLAPVPRQFPAHGTITVSGRLFGKFGDPELMVTTPGGLVRRQTMPYRQGRFEGRVPCDAGEGTYQVEIGGTDRGGPAVLANFPVFCGGEPPARIAVVEANAVLRPTPQTPEEAERELFSLINRARAAAHLPALILDPRLAQVARSHSLEMAQTGRVAHVSPRSGSVLDRLKAAHLEPPKCAENVGQDYSAAQVHADLMASPGHRGNIVHPEVTHVGIGVAAGQDRALYFTEVFVAWK